MTTLSPYRTGIVDTLISISFSPTFKEIEVITQAQEYLRSKQLPKAQRLLVEYIKKNPHSEQAWFVLSTAVDDPRKQIECLQRVLRINPANKEAQARLMKAMSAPQPEPSATTQAAAGQPPASEPAPSAAPSIEKSVPSSEPQTAEPLLGEAVKPIEPAAATADTDLSGLRSKVKYVKPRRQRKRWPRIVILLLLILLAAIVGGYLMWNNFFQAASPPVVATPATPTELLHGVAELLDVALPGREDAAEDHGFRVLEARQRLFGRPVPVGDRVADPGVAELLDPGDEIPDLAGPQDAGLDGLRREVADLLGLVLRARGHDDDLVSRPELAVDDPDEDDDAAVGVEPGIEQERLERGLGLPLGGRDALDDDLEELRQALPRLR